MTRPDRIPNNEYVEWQDRGCNLHPSCLRCPLAVCQFDAPRAKGRPTQAGTIAELRARGMRPMEIADVLGLNKRSVFRALAATRESAS